MNPVLYEDGSGTLLDITQELFRVLWLVLQGLGMVGG